MVLDVSKTLVLEGLVDLVCDPVEFFLGARSSRFQIDDGNTQRVDSRADHVELGSWNWNT